MTRKEMIDKCIEFISRSRPEGSNLSTDGVDAMNCIAWLKSIKELPKGLENAAQDSADLLQQRQKNYSPTYWCGAYDGFLAGAEYQRKQDQQLIELAEDHAMLAGMNKMKGEMMEKAVGGRYMKADGKVYVESWPLDIDPDSVKAGDEARLIVIPKEH